MTDQSWTKRVGTTAGEWAMYAGVVGGIAVLGPVFASIWPSAGTC